MKKLLLIAAVAVFGLSNVIAQEETTKGGFANGDVYLSGTVGYNSSKQDEAKASQLTFSPAVGFFVSDNIAIEANLLVGSGKEEFGEFEDKSSTFGAGLAALYFFTPENQFSFIVSAGASYATTKVEPDGSDEIKTNAFGFAVAPGLNYFISDCIALRASIGALSYTSTKLDEEGAEARNDFGLNLNLSDINFGITYKF